LTTRDDIPSFSFGRRNITTCSEKGKLKEGITFLVVKKGKLEEGISSLVVNMVS
jgi:hypothetical protein